MATERKAAAGAVWRGDPRQAPDGMQTLEGNYIKVFGGSPKTEEGQDLRLGADPKRPAMTRPVDYMRSALKPASEIPDIDELVRNYPPTDGKLAVLGVGADSPAAEKLGQVDELRRDGDDLIAKVSGAHPKLDELHSAGHLPRRAITVERTPAGVVLRRIGLQPADANDPGSLESFRKSLFSKSEFQFSDLRRGPALDNGWVEFTQPLRSEAVSRLKRQGKWLNIYDDFGLPVVFGELEKQGGAFEFVDSKGQARSGSSAESLVTILEYLRPALEDLDLDRRARRIARERELTYSEGLRLAGEQRSREGVAARYEGRPGDPGTELPQ